MLNKIAEHVRLYNPPQQTEKSELPDFLFQDGAGLAEVCDSKSVLLEVLAHRANGAGARTELTSELGGGEKVAVVR